jgi:thiamine biosynthesis lipoprotein
MFSRGFTPVVLMLAWCAAEAGDLQRLEIQDEAMGGTWAIVLYGHDRANLEAASAAAVEELHRLDHILSNYQAGSEWSAVNRTAGREPLKISPELFQLLSACLSYSRKSEGAFDITVGPLLKVWGFYKAEGSLPRPAEVAQALVNVGYRQVRLDSANQTVQFDRPGVELDPGGIGKGYAVDRMVEVLKRYGIDRALISGAGSSIYGLGAPPGDPEGWRITIRAQHDARKAAEEVFLKNMSLSTSGSYERFFRAGGRRYSHIMDPRTGYPAQGTASVSVLAPHTIDSEAWSKPYFINGRAWTAAHKPADFRVFLCEDTNPQACSWVQ